MPCHSHPVLLDRYNFIWRRVQVMKLLDIVHRLVSESDFCLRLQVNPTQFGTIDRAGPYLRRLGHRHKLLNFMEIQIMQFSPTSCHLIPLQSGAKLG
jgi:hypothetical protein